MRSGAERGEGAERCRGATLSQSEQKESVSSRRKKLRSRTKPPSAAQLTAHIMTRGTGRKACAWHTRADGCPASHNHKPCGLCRARAPRMHGSDEGAAAAVQRSTSGVGF